jgi:hypothetical protein
MRIRLRVPLDGEVKLDGFRGWFQRFRDAFNASSIQSTNGETAPRCYPQQDKRWSTRGDVKYLLEGRHCRKVDGAWHSEYIFTILAGKQRHQIRVFLPEGPITAWEKRHDQRMTEDRRLQLARETMEALIDRHRFPATVSVPADTIDAASIE